MQERDYQDAAAWTDDERVRGHYADSGRPLYLRRLVREWARQHGKTTSLAKKALRQMMRNPGRLVTFASANLNIAAEMIEKESSTWHALLRELRADASLAKCSLQIGQATDGKDHTFRALPDGIALDDLSSVMERSALELRIYHSRTLYSRTKVIAARVQTAVSWSGTVYLDEGGKLPDLQILIQEIEPIFGTDPSFTFEMAGTPPPDTAHYFNRLITPADGDLEFPVNPAGNWYTNKVGIWVHRVTIDDGAAAGRKCYHPDSGEEQTVEQDRENSMDKEGWDRSYRLRKSLTGTNAVSPAALSTCQSLGAGRCIAGGIDCANGKVSALMQLEELLGEALNLTGHGRLTLGHDIATTEKKTSNPSALTLMERVGVDYPARLIVWWKTADPDLSIALLEHAVTIIRKAERRPMSLTVDASNELYHCRRIRKALSGIIPVRLARGGERIEQGDQATDLKTHAGNQLANHMESSRVPIANHPYLESDFGRVVKQGGKFDCAIGTNGEHGDTFDATKLALLGQIGGGPVEIKATPVTSQPGPRPGLFHPLAKIVTRLRRRN